MRTRFIAYLALFTSSITFGSGLLVFLYMKSPAFEDQLLGQVMKHMDWIVENELEKQIQKLNMNGQQDFQRGILRLLHGGNIIVVNLIVKFLQVDHS